MQGTRKYSLADNRHLPRIPCTEQDFLRRSIQRLFVSTSGDRDYYVYEANLNQWNWVVKQKLYTICICLSPLHMSYTNAYRYILHSSYPDSSSRPATNQRNAMRRAEKKNGKTLDFRTALCNVCI